MSFKLIVIEGIDGSGKSTIANHLSNKLSIRGKTKSIKLSKNYVKLFSDYCESKNLGEPKKFFDNGFRQECYIIEAIAQFDALKNLYPNLEYLVADRWPPFTRHYHHHIYREPEFFGFLLDQLPTPDYFFLLNVSPLTAIERLKTRGDWMLESYSENDAMNFLINLDKNYKILSQSYQNIVVLPEYQTITKNIDDILQHIQN